MVPRLALFDYGGVLVESPLRRMERYAEEHGVQGATGPRLVFGADADEEHPWHRLERGEIDFAAYRDQYAIVCERHALSLPCPSLSEIYDLRPRRRLIRQLREWRSPQLMIGIATNNIAEMRTWWREQVDAWGFDVVFDSSLLHVRKPEPGFYSAIAQFCQSADIALNCTWLLDDVGGNVEGASKAGLRGLLARARRTGY
jgi:FMN phosphatase YigB (HAD superfamily)